MHDEALERLNALPHEQAVVQLLQCCGSHDWAERMAASRPFDDLEALYDTGDRIWRTLPRDAVREAFDAHPRIGERKAAAAQTLTETRWSAGEQAGMQRADESIAAEIARLQRAYEQRFGHIFLICAAGRSAEEMLASLRSRMHNDMDAELAVAAEEQRRITRLRLEKLVSP